MASDKDLVDKIFDTGYNLFSSGSELASSVKSKVLTAIKDSGDDDVVNVISKGNYLPRTTNNNPPTNISKFVTGVYDRLNFKVFLGIGISATSVLLFWKLTKALSVPQYLTQPQLKCVLIFGDMHDPIVRSQVMDLYRRRFIVFVCTEHANQYKEKDNGDEFLRFIDPLSVNDLSNFLEFLRKPHSNPVELVSILFMPNSSYYPSGEISLDQLERELHSNILLYYNALSKIVPHIRNETTQCILFNPSLSSNLGIAHHSAEIIASGMVQSISKTLESYNTLSIYHVNLGIIQIGGQPSNYKYLNLEGAPISSSLLTPTFKLIMYHSGNLLQKFILKIVTFGGLSRTFYFGRYSWVSSSVIGRLIIKVI
ncbi:hypothetical protein Kpol_1018p124 [Vanderwaltozyma polyspora DSM 70294]|uniref:DUF1776-domain-containing protein n=1 Tax=Vanderwaltozyma polyspora (strain ATCC 22028 / DSM 70294 / BCRC 21397 / CBS 2163 / NBRC 10782 / NRRL Y-8283 / UCD 57-17) TaxID=436907 RepID=A7TDW7_VANPO|nr:uncharacterized protein Kpol_1018p124 [Vanderwaltozyma polyspora DSM 70294]EDO19587.1 hypothetical protein Kpol_1018p124 [Vanderwaltozyma polyspora DSM 70294]